MTEDVKTILDLTKIGDIELHSVLSDGTRLKVTCEFDDVMAEAKRGERLGLTITRVVKEVEV